MTNLVLSLVMIVSTNAFPNAVPYHIDGDGTRYYSGITTNIVLIAKIDGEEYGKVMNPIVIGKGATRKTLVKYEPILYHMTMGCAQDYKVVTLTNYHIECKPTK